MVRITGVAVKIISRLDFLAAESADAASLLGIRSMKVSLGKRFRQSAMRTALCGTTLFGSLGSRFLLGTGSDSREQFDARMMVVDHLECMSEWINDLCFDGNR